MVGSTDARSTDYSDWFTFSAAVHRVKDLDTWRSHRFTNERPMPALPPLPPPPVGPPPSSEETLSIC